MSDFSLVIIPLTIIPGVALVLSSTAGRFNYVASEINKLYLSNVHECDYIIQKQLLRSRLFTNAIVSLYLSISFLLLSSFVGITSNSLLPKNYNPEIILVVLFSIGIFFALLGVSILLYESFIIRKVIRRKIDHITERNPSESSGKLQKVWPFKGRRKPSKKN